MSEAAPDVAARRRARRDRVADRLLLLLGAGASLLAWTVAWFGWMRPGTSSSVRLGLTGLALGVSALVLFRRRLHRVVAPTRLLALALGIAVPLAAVELAANLTNPQGYLVFAEGQRYFYWQRYQGILQDHAHPPSSQLRFPWGTVTTNDEGWRSPPLTLAPPPGTLRVLALGDSFCFSWGVDDSITVCEEAARALRATPALSRFTGVEVVNTGNGSNCGIDELLTLKERGLAYGPHVVFLLVCSNDFTDRPVWRDQVEALERLGVEDPATLAVMRATAAERPTPQAPPTEPARTLFGAVSQLINRSFTIGMAAKLRRELASPAPAPAPGSTEPDRAPVSAPAPRVDLAAAFPYLAEGTAAIQEIAATCRRRGLPLAVRVISLGPVEVELTAHLRRAVGDGPLVEPLPWPADPTRYRNSAMDGHWNAAGTAYFGARIAESITEVLERRGQAGSR